jgi:hypothetical protein
VQRRTVYQGPNEGVEARLLLVEPGGHVEDVFSWMCLIRIRCPVLQASLPEVYDKTAEINEFTVLQLLFEDRYTIVSDHQRRKGKGLTSIIGPCPHLRACQHDTPCML